VLLDLSPNGCDMLLLEHHGKTLFRKHGVSTPVGAVIRDDSSLAQVLLSLPPRLVLKAQIATGGRGKGGGIAFADDAEEARRALAALLRNRINGHSVELVLVEERMAFTRERYAGIVIEDGEIRLLFGRSGGVDLEDITAADPTNIVSIAVDPIEGPAAGQLQDCFAQLDYAPGYWAAYERIGRALFAMSCAYDATMIEINPLAELPEGRLVALDARVAIDDAALDRQPDIAAMQPHPHITPRAPNTFAGLKFRKNTEGGAIGLIGLGGGLNVALMDWIAGTGSKVAVLVDIDDAIGSGQAQQGLAAALEAFDRNPSIRSVLINIITCGYRLDEIVASLLLALGPNTGQPAKPVILHLRGNGVARAQQLLSAAGWTNSPSIAAAIEAAVAAARS
jgi:succinyl-CoA synthetase beta subunit